MIPLFMSGRSAALTASAALIVGGATAVVAPQALATQAAPKTCYDGTGMRGDGRLTAPISTFENFTTYESTDQTCTTPTVVFWTVVKANNRTSALKLCDSLGFFNADSMTTAYPKVPGNWYECNYRGG
jgi:hypothetical protein